MRMVDVISRLHSLTRFLANLRRKLVLTPVNVNNQNPLFKESFGPTKGTPQQSWAA
jgi:hypothetical protein